MKLEKYKRNLKDGDIIEQGTHEELISMHGLYNSLYYSQFESE